MSNTTVTRCRNVNYAFENLKVMARNRDAWRNISPRGMETLEWKSPVITEYTHPCERVLFSPARDANPFFHLFESLWILDGRKDVAFLAKFLPRMAEFSDDGINFHAPYGYRLRFHFASGRRNTTVDQLAQAIDLLSTDHTTRRAVMTIWDPSEDLNVNSKDIPCNDAVFLKIRDGALEMTVMCRSNDVILGCYGANVVQFSMLQEFMARAIGVKVGVYRQLSDSFHMYTDSEVWKRVVREEVSFGQDYYSEGYAWPYPLIQTAHWSDWLVQLSYLLKNDLASYTGKIDPFFTHVAAPLLKAWDMWSNKDETPEREDRINWAADYIHRYVAHCDWSMACEHWLARRKLRKEAA